MITAQSRLKVLDKPELAPGVCFLCGSAGDDKRKFIDFGKNIEWYGTVYVCTFCVIEVAEAADFTPVSNFDALHNEYRELRVKYDQLVAKYAPFEKAIKNVLDSPDPGFGMVLHPSNLRIDRGEGDKLDESDSNESASGESEANESVDLEGPDDLFDSTDFDDE
ncbi:hypothetical protein [Streptomyces rochei]|uniref:hypothetical protein n=1 Tax=Streptomyces rochei TaxID=1928 RepID=UPI00367C95B6